MRKITFLGLLILFLLPFSAFAASQLNNGEVQLSVGGFLLDILDTNANLDQIDFNSDNSFTVTLSSSQFIKIGSSDRKKFIYSPTNLSNFVTTTCDANKSTITVQTPSNISQIAITINLSDTCAIDSGGGSLGTLVLPPPTAPSPPPGGAPGLPIFNPTPEPSPMLQPPGGVPGILTPPAPAPTPAPQPTPPLPFIPPILQSVIQTIKQTVAPAPETIQGLKEITLGISNIISRPNSAGKIINNLRASKPITELVKNIFQPLTIVLGIFGFAMLALTALQASAAFANLINLSRFFTLALFPYKRNPWGRVLEKLTNKPVPGALVQVYEEEFKKLKDTQLTDNEGRFGSFVGKGKYFVKVTKDGFLDKETEVLTIERDNQILNLEIKISPVEEELSLDYLKRINFVDILKRLLDKLNPVLLIIGTVLSLIALVILPTILNYIVFSIYILLDLLKIYFILHFVKPFGKVSDVASFLPLPLAVVRIFDLNKQLLLATKATDDKGRFNFLIAPGEYYLTCVKGGYMPFRSNPVKYTKAALETTDIKLQKPQTPASPTPPPQPTPPTSPVIPATPSQATI